MLKLCLAWFRFMKYLSTRSRNHPFMKTRNKGAVSKPPVAGAKRENIGIDSAQKHQVDVIAKVRGISLKQASAEAWDMWLALYQKEARAVFPVLGESGRRAVAA